MPNGGLVARFPAAPTANPNLGDARSAAIFRPVNRFTPFSSAACYFEAHQLRHSELATLERTEAASTVTPSAAGESPIPLSRSATGNQEGGVTWLEMSN